MKIGLLSDTHGFLDPAVFKHFAECDEIWHAGDIGDFSVYEELKKYKPLRGVFGNIDGTRIRNEFPEIQKFEVEGVRIFMIHIGGYPGSYAKNIKEKLIRYKPHLFISGHSHILKVQRDPKINNMLHINPGAAGKYGFHVVRTLVRFDINNGKISNLEVIELGPRTGDSSV